MDHFRRFVIGLAQFALICVIVLGTVAGAVGGYELGTPRGSPYAVGAQETQLVLVVLGALAGFLISSLPTAVFMLLIQIERNTRRV
jgi:hypothetical protein